MNKTVGLIYKSIVIDEVFIARIIRRINVPADFDTIEKAFSGVKTAEKGIKQGLSRSNADFGSPCYVCSIGVQMPRIIVDCTPSGVLILQ